MPPPPFNDYIWRRISALITADTIKRTRRYSQISTYKILISEAITPLAAFESLLPRRRYSHFQSEDIIAIRLLRHFCFFALTACVDAALS